MPEIDKESLKALANDPNVSTRAAFEKLGFNNYATFDYQLKKGFGSEPHLARGASGCSRG